MNLMEELKQIYQQQGITGLLPQNLPDNVLEALLIVGDDIYFNRPVDDDAWTELMSFLWHAARPFEKPTTQDIKTFSLILRLEDFRRRGIVTLDEEFTIENLFISWHGHTINLERLQAYQDESRKKIAQYYIDIEKN